MSIGKAISAALELGVFFKRAYVKNKKDDYEQERTNSSSGPADRFESKFGGDGLREPVQRNKANNDERG